MIKGARGLAVLVQRGIVQLALTASAELDAPDIVVERVSVW